MARRSTNEKWQRSGNERNWATKHLLRTLLSSS